MTAEVFLGTLILVILACCTIIISIITISMLGQFLYSVWDVICGLRDAILDFVNGRANK